MDTAFLRCPVTFVAGRSDVLTSVPTSRRPRPAARTPRWSCCRAATSSPWSTRERVQAALDALVRSATDLAPALESRCDGRHARTAHPRTPDDVAELVRALLADLDALTDRLVAAILAEDPTYGGARPHDVRGPAALLPRQPRAAAAGPDRRPRRRASTPSTRRAPPAPGGREQGMPLESVLHAYRLGYRTIWEGLVAPGPHRGAGRRPPGRLARRRRHRRLGDRRQLLLRGRRQLPRDRGRARPPATSTGATPRSTPCSRAAAPSARSPSEAAATLDLPEHGPVRRPRA